MSDIWIIQNVSRISESFNFKVGCQPPVTSLKLTIRCWKLVVKEDDLVSFLRLKIPIFSGKIDSVQAVSKAPLPGATDDLSQVREGRDKTRYGKMVVDCLGLSDPRDSLKTKFFAPETN